MTRECGISVGIDARLAVARGRGWGRYAADFLMTLAELRNAPSVRVLLPETPSAKKFGSRIGRSPGFRVAYAPFELPSGDDYLARALDADDPVRHLGPVDVVHSLTRFAVDTTAPATIATVHDIAPLSNPPFKLETLAMTQRALDGLRRRDATLLAVSESTRSDLIERAGFEARSIHVVPPGVSDRFHAAHASHDDCTSGTELLTVGGAGANKNLGRLIDAVAILRRSHPVRLTMIGARAWGYDSLLAHVESVAGASAGGWFRFLDYVDDERLASLYRGALVVVPSLHEGFGLPVLEAMASGATVACSDLAVFREVAGDVAYRFDPYDPADIARVLAEALTDTGRRRRCIGECIARSQRFRWADAVAKIVERYECAASRGQVSRPNPRTPIRETRSRREPSGRHGVEPIDIATVAFSSAHDDAHDHFDLIDRCVSSIVGCTDRRRFRLHVGCNHVSPRVRRRLEALRSQCDVRFVEGKMHRDACGAAAYPKYPLMRRLLAGVESRWFVWFDDDSYATEKDWLDALTERIELAEEHDGRCGIAQLGKLADAPMMNPAPGWIEKAAWRNTAFEHEYLPCDAGTKRVVCPFVVGGFFALKTAAMRGASIPDPRLFHNGGDWTTGLALAHQGYSVADHRYGVVINAAPRRGIHADRWYPPGQAASMQVVAISADQRRFDDAATSERERTST